jgi:hypothetical protein
MALAQQVEGSLKEAEASLRNALSFAARSERPMVTSMIAKMIQSIDTLISTDSLFDKLETRQKGSKGVWDEFFTDTE